MNASRVKSIRDVIAFPKTQRRSVCFQVSSYVDESQLELHIKVIATGTRRSKVDIKASEGRGLVVEQTREIGYMISKGTLR